jgi:hypothetical protein
MPARSQIILLLCAAVFLAGAGCLSLSVGSVSYDNGNLSVIVTNSGDPVDAGVQVRIFQVDGMAQREQEMTGTPVSLAHGTNTVPVPVMLEPGTYKIYVYLTINGERQAAVIRDIMVG